ncbi:hypothetical protein CK203_093354 [Vitis vinifera]|uniref:Uncharacterized protein n=1 Tax=Vitis vinifera TaxID=29760 RepID=A0A438F7P1_VITVI|nr:hypothetical protein CK203_093354 [Vitis vinifera]
METQDESAGGTKEQCKTGNAFIRAVKAPGTLILPMSPSGDGAGGRCACFSWENGGSDPDDPHCPHCGGSDPSSCSSILSNSIRIQDSEKLWRIVTASAKGFTIGVGIKGGLAIFSVVARLIARLRRRRLSAYARKFSNSEDVVIALKETLRYGLFLGPLLVHLFQWMRLWLLWVVIVGIYFDLTGKATFYCRTARWRSLLAGAIAGPSMLLSGPNTQHTTLAIYILMRAAVLASRCGIKSKRFGRICKPLTWSHGDIFLMCLSSSQILYVLFFLKSNYDSCIFRLPLVQLGHLDKPKKLMVGEPKKRKHHVPAWYIPPPVELTLRWQSAYILKQESLPPSYKSFLNKHGGKDPIILQAVKDIASGIPFTNLEAVENYYNTIGVKIKLDPSMKVPCSIIHGHQSCSKHVVSFLIQAYKRALPVYLPVYLIPALIVHRQDLLKR